MVLISTPMEDKSDAAIIGRSSMKVLPMLRGPSVAADKPLELVKYSLMSSGSVARQIHPTKNNA
jgi:hypothetical protein